MTLPELIKQIRSKGSCLCIGLDADLAKIPQHLLTGNDPVFEFNKQLIDATHEFCVAYKPNTAFYEALGIKGWQSLEKTVVYLTEYYPNHFTIADAKRGDIGNTCHQYAKAFFTNMDFDAVTVAPYMGSDSVQPFLEYENKFVILLALTSNKGAFDFQTLKTENGLTLYENVLKTSLTWSNSERLMFVTGATQASYLKHIRSIAPSSFFLVPGIGAQGGDLDDVMKNAMNENVGLLINSSREIIYASNGTDFARAAAIKAKEVAAKMKPYISG
ncbi:MAG TPA: orotidine-5'-phosphate decarboxylase [Flavobacteriales bacterium]|nr:orotidine-5'-phosphate decarboxylase [Flavobacteriales bacterium]